MENILATMSVFGCILLILAGALPSGGLAILGIILMVISVLMSVATGQGSSFGPNATHSNRYPYRRKHRR